MPKRIRTIGLFGHSFPVHWERSDHRQIANPKKCYELVSFDSTEKHDQDLLRRSKLSKIDWCWLVNPNYERDGIGELADWTEAGHDAYDLPPEAETSDGHYLPPEARGLPVTTIQGAVAGGTLARGITSGMYLLEIIKEAFPGGSYGQVTAGIPILRATCVTGEILYLRDLIEQDVPEAATSQWRLDKLLKQKQQPGRPIKKIGRLKYTNDFKQVWVDDRVYDLSTRTMARLCIKYLVEKKAFNSKSARLLKSEIDRFVRSHARDLPTAADIRIQHYFTSSNRRGLPTLCKKLIRAAGRNGRYYLAVE